MQLPEYLTFRWRPFTKVFIATLRHSVSGELLAITPLVEHKDPLRFSIAGKEFAKISLNGVFLSGSIPAFPCSDEHYEALCRAVLAMPSVDCLYIWNLPTFSPFWRFLTRAKKTHREWLFYTPGNECYPYLYIDTTTSYDEYLSKFKASTRQKFKQRRRQFERDLGGRLDLVRVCDAGDVPQFLAAAHAIAKKSWQQGLIGLHVDQPASRQEFLESMARQGVLRSYLLRADKKVFAYLIGFQSNGVYYVHETAFDEAYAGTRFSPGQLLFYLGIRDCFEVDKPDMFHFGPGEYWYKTLFANQSAKEVGTIILKNSAANKARVTAHRLFRKGVEMVKARMNPETLAVIRRAVGDKPGVYPTALPKLAPDGEGQDGIDGNDNADLAQDIPIIRTLVRIPGDGPVSPHVV
jgi:hypothetical protein